MSGTCHDTSAGPVSRPAGEFVLALAGNPNVGKSTLFNALTGLGVSTAHYPGTTREVSTATARFENRIIGVVDLPGAYGIAGTTEDEMIARRALIDMVPDVVVVVVDAVNLARTLYLALEVLDLGFRVVLAVNLADEAARAGIAVDAGRLGEALGVPVVETVATRGIGLAKLVTAARTAAQGDLPSPLLYGPDIEGFVAPVAAAAAQAACLPIGLTSRAAALAMIEGLPEAEDSADEALRQAATEARSAMADYYGEPAAVALARHRHGVAGTVGQSVVTRRKPTGRVPRDLWSLTTWPWTGVPLAAVIAGSIFSFLFFAGTLLAGAFAAVWQAYASPAITWVIGSIAGEGTVAKVLLWGFDAGIEASLSVGLPYILVFYVLLGLLEDTGYLNSLAFLTDRFMHRLGLHGRAIVSLVAGAGCSVPALIATRSLPTKREQLIASTLVMFIPCSARTAVILGAVGHYVGWQYTLLVMGIVFVMWLGIALVLQRMLPGESTGLVMEMFPFRRPSLRRVIAKAWVQFKEFLFVATPIVVVGSLVLGGLYENGWLMDVSRPLEPVVGGWLGLPAVAGVTLLMGMLRNELSLQLLVVLAVSSAGFAGAQVTDIMSGSQLVVFALFNTIAFPCISAVAVFWRRNGLRRTLAVLVLSITLALAIGGIVARILPALGLQ